MRITDDTLGLMRKTVFSGILLLTLLGGCTPAPGSPDPATTGSGAVGGKVTFEDVLSLAQEGNHDAEFELGTMYQHGDGVTQDLAKAIEWYRKSASAGNRQAAFNLALMYRDGIGTKENLEAARRWFTRAEELGDVRAAYQLGQMSYLGTGMTQNFGKALEYYRKAAKGGLADAQMNVGVMYIRGEGVAAQDVVEGYAWLTLASEGESARAQTLLASLSEKLSDTQKKEGDTRTEALRLEIKKTAGINAAK